MSVAFRWLATQQWDTHHFGRSHPVEVGEESMLPWIWLGVQRFREKKSFPTVDSILWRWVIGEWRSWTESTSSKLADESLLTTDSGLRESCRLLVCVENGKMTDLNHYNKPQTRSVVTAFGIMLEEGIHERLDWTESIFVDGDQCFSVNKNVMMFQILHVRYCNWIQINVSFKYANASNFVFLSKIAWKQKPIPAILLWAMIYLTVSISVVTVYYYVVRST